MFVARALPRTNPGSTLRSGVASLASRAVVAHPHGRPQARWNSTGSTGSSTSSTLNAYAPVAVAALLSGVAGYFLARPSNESKKVSAKPAEAHVKFNEQYGSHEDFAKAIEELRVALPGEGVSTDEAVLKKHGMAFGVNFQPRES